MYEQLALIGPSFPKSMQDHPQKIKTAFPQIAIDGGIHFSDNPILWVGDGDSTHDQYNNSLPLTLKTSQDETDLRFCLNVIHEWKWKRLHLYGFLGNSRDHELANLGEVYRELNTKDTESCVQFYGEELTAQLFFFSAGKHQLNIQGLFSTFVFEESKVTIQGQCSFPLTDGVLYPFSGSGVSNHATGVVEVKSTVPILISIGSWK